MDIKKAKNNYDKYLQDGLLKKVYFKKIVYDTYMNNSLESLEVAIHLSSNNKSNLWIIVSSYYAMFYIASAYVYKRGYKTTGKIIHQVINESLIVLGIKDLTMKIIEEYEEEKIKASGLAQGIIENLNYEKQKRSVFQYETTEKIKQSKANTSLRRAKEFVQLFREILEKRETK